MARVTIVFEGSVYCVAIGAGRLPDVGVMRIHFSQRGGLGRHRVVGAAMAGQTLGRIRRLGRPFRWQGSVAAEAVLALCQVPAIKKLRSRRAGHDL